MGFFWSCMYLLLGSDLGTWSNSCGSCSVIFDVARGSPILFHVALLNLRWCLEALKIQQASSCSNFAYWVMAKEGVQLHINKLCLVSGAVITLVGYTARDSGTGQETMLKKPSTRWKQVRGLFFQPKGPFQTQWMEQCAVPERSATSWLWRICTLVPLTAAGNKGNKLPPPRGRMRARTWQGVESLPNGIWWF